VQLSAGGLAGFERGVRGTRAGTVCPLIQCLQERGSAGERSFATLGHPATSWQDKRPRENQTRQDPQNLSFRFFLKLLTGYVIVNIC
jgi:hypothetical protein